MMGMEAWEGVTGRERDKKKMLEKEAIMDQNHMAKRNKKYKGVS